MNSAEVSIGDVLLTRRRDLDLLNSDVAILCGLSPATISRLERNKIRLSSLVTASALARGLDLSPFTLPILAVRSGPGDLATPPPGFEDEYRAQGRWPMSESLSAQVCARREEMGLTERGLERRCGLSRGWILAVEAHQRPTIPTLVKIADTTGIPRWQLAVLAVQDEQRRETHVMGNAGAPGRTDTPDPLAAEKQRPGSTNPKGGPMANPWLDADDVQGDDGE